MPSFLFWNLGGKNLSAELTAVCRDHDIDVVVLAECEIPTQDLINAVNAEKGQTYVVPINYSAKLTFLTKFPPESIVPLLDEGGLAIRQIKPPLGPDLLLAAVHLPSKLHFSNEDHIFHVTRVIRQINEVEDRLGHDRTIILGDLNMNPFDAAMVGADGLHAVSARSVAAEGSRIVQGHRRKFFYNPMWHYMGDAGAKPAGTYFYRSSTYLSYFWNTFDQVLLRPPLMNYFEDDALKIVTDIRGKLLFRNGRISNDYSDHLPITVTIQTEGA